MATVAEERALFIMNQLKDSLASLARGIKDALADGKLDFIETLQLTTQGTATAASTYSLISGLSSQDLNAFLSALEKLDFVLPDGKTDSPF